MEPEIELRLNARLCNEELAILFKAAWGDQAPDVPPAVEHCLAHICAYSNERLVGFVKLAWDGGIHSGIEWLHVDYDQPLERFYAACGFSPTRAGLIKLAGARG